MSKHDQDTRAIYQKQHERISSNKSAFDRIGGMYDSNTFGMSSGWFDGKSAIDIGCGNIGTMIIRLLKLGCTNVTGVDIDSDWIKPLSENIKSEGFDEELFHLKKGSVISIPYDDSSFDFVAVNGVLIHLENLEEIYKGFMDAARVTANNGVLYTSWGPCGGVMQSVIFPALRNHYRNDHEFKKFIDQIAPDQIHTAIEKIGSDSEKYGGEYIDVKAVKSLFGEDFCVFLQNFIQAPTWWSNECTPEYVEDLYKEAGFKQVRRVTSFTKRTDVRKYFAPLHFDRNYWLSKIMYGQGYVQYVGEKKQ